MFASWAYTASMASVAPLAIDEDTVTPGALGFLVVVAMGVALFLLIRSMNNQIGRIQAPKEADLKQAEWERSQAAERRTAPSPADAGDQAAARAGKRAAERPGKDDGGRPDSAQG